MKQAIVLSLFLVVLAGVPALGDQDLLLSKQSKGFNFDPAFAVNPNNGDLLATWVREVPLEKSSQFEIWVSRAKRKANGKYKKKVKARKLSLSGVRPESNRKPRVAWIDENGEFFVVWEQKKFASNQTSIFGHAVTAAGVPKGELVSLTTDGKKNASPVVTASASGAIQRTPMYSPPFEGIDDPRVDLLHDQPVLRNLEQALECHGHLGRSG